MCLFEELIFNFLRLFWKYSPFNPPSHNKSYIHVIIDTFSHFVVTVPIKANNAKTAIKLFYTIKFGPPIYLVTEGGSEFFNKEMAHFVRLWELDTPLEQLILLGQMA